MKTSPLLHLQLFRLTFVFGVLCAFNLHAQIDSARLPMKSLVVGNTWVYQIDGRNETRASDEMTTKKFYEQVIKDTIVNAQRYSQVFSSFDQSTRLERSNDTAIYVVSQGVEIVQQTWNLDSLKRNYWEGWAGFSSKIFGPNASWVGSGYIQCSGNKSSGKQVFTESYVSFFPNSSTYFVLQYQKNIGLLYVSNYWRGGAGSRIFTRGQHATLIGSSIEGKPQGALDFSMLLSSANLVGRSGDTVTIPVIVAGMKQRASIDTSAFAVTLSFNASLLEPIGTTPKGVVLNGIRTIPLSLPYISGSDSSQLLLSFRAAIGNDTTTALRLSAVQTGIQFTTTINNGTFRLRGNTAGGSQIRFFSQSRALAALDISPNPLSSDVLHSILTLERAVEIRYSLVHFLGSIELSGAMALEKGTHSIELPIQNLCSGSYLLVVQTNDEVITKKIQIMR